MSTRAREIKEDLDVGGRKEVSHMPIYEYQCNSCGKHIELLQKVNSQMPRGCPVCGGKLTKVVTKPSAIIFKGSGFYATDYGKRSASQRKKGSP